MSDNDEKYDVAFVEEGDPVPEGATEVARFAIVGNGKDGLAAFQRWIELADSLADADPVTFSRAHSARVKDMGLERTLQEIAHLGALQLSVAKLSQALVRDVGNLFGPELEAKVQAGEAEAVRHTPGVEEAQGRDFALDGINRMTGYSGGN